MGVNQMLINFRGDRSQEQMAKIYGVSQQTWSTWENGTRTPTKKIMKRISDDSGIAMDVLFFDSFNYKK